MKKEKFGRISKLSLGYALGITWGLCMVFSGWLSVTGWGAWMVKVFSSVYMGYDSGFLGGIIGGVWGFIDGFIGGAVMAFIYNHFVSKRA